MKQYFAMLLLSLAATACTVSTKPINYGQEACHFCSMTIVDRQHAAEVVTNKGKVFKYDAIECMINDTRKWEKSDYENIALVVINDYSNPGKFTDAKTATYLISEQIKSPMGAFLSGFSSANEAQKVQHEKTGDLFTWDSLQEKIQ